MFQCCPQSWSNSGSSFLEEDGYSRRVPTKRFSRNHVFKNVWHIFFRNCLEIEIQGYIMIFSSLKTWCLRDVGNPPHVNHVHVALRHVSKVICKTISNDDHIILHYISICIRTDRIIRSSFVANEWLKIVKKSVGFFPSSFPISFSI